MPDVPTQLGPYQIDREIGRGGMGVVYLARDTKLDRPVAIKALPEHLAQDPDRLARFEREARTLAALTHPNVAGIYGIETHDNAKYLILEYVEGETLAERLDRGQIPVDETLELATQIAAGVEAAHEAGVIHRDLKPDNIKITPDGQIKVLDFGLAKSSETQTSASSTNLPTVTSPAILNSPTIPGAIMGTAPYMSPEQARGRTVDKRTDIWSFGVILYEMLTSASPFRGETVSDSIGAILHKDVDRSLLPPETPRAARRVLDRCLERDKHQRYRDIGDIRIDLASADAEPVIASTTGKRNVALMALLVLVALLASAGWIMSLIGSDDAGSIAKAPPVRLTIPLPDDLEVRGAIAIARDGRTIAFNGRDNSGQSKLYLRRLDRYGLTEIPGSKDGHVPFFSPDGESVGFFARSAIWRASLAGGAPRMLTPSQSLIGATWLDDGTIIYSSGLNSPLLRMTESGQPMDPVTALADDPGAYAHVWPQHIPGTSKVLFTVWGSDRIKSAGGGGGGRLVDTDSGQIRRIVPQRDTFDPPMRWSASGHVLFENFDEGLLAHTFDPESTEPIPFPAAKQLLDGVSHMGNTTRSKFALSENGVLAYVPLATNDRWLAWVDEDGAVEPLIDNTALDGFTALSGFVSLSDDGGTALIGGAGDIIEIDLERRLPRRLTSGDGNKLGPLWSADESGVIYASNLDQRWSIWRVGVGANSEAKLLFQTEDNVYPRSVGPSGEIAFMRVTKGSNGNDIWILDPDGSPRPLVQTTNNESMPNISVDGAWVAYQSDASGEQDIYAVRSDGAGAPVQVSIGGGTAPLWGPSGETLYFRKGRNVVRIGFDDGQLIGEPTQVFNAPNLLAGRSFALTADEKRMLAIQVDEDSIASEIRVITNFFDEIRRVAGDLNDPER